MNDSREHEILALGKRPATPTCYRLAVRSLRAAAIQVDRIWSHNLTVPPDQVDVLAGDILIDIHFYFISLRRLYGYLKKIVDDPAFAHCAPSLEALNQQWFKHYSLGREAFEHIDQRLPGEKHEHLLVEIEENGARRRVQYGLRMSQGLFYHSNQSWDISATCFERIGREVAGFFIDLTDGRPLPSPNAA
jgi:hypothetical protein